MQTIPVAFGPNLQEPGFLLSLIGRTGQELYAQYHFLLLIFFLKRAREYVFSLAVS